MDQDIEIKNIQSLSKLSAKAWNALVGPDNVFLEYAFLEGLEASGSVGTGTGWEPHYVLAYKGHELVGAAPAYLKTHSYGEYIFDFGWAEAFARAGLSYYPKLVVGVPFTPATGSRFLLAEDPDGLIFQALVQGIESVAKATGCRSVHALFVSERERDLLKRKGYWNRSGFQYHWENQGWACFEDFLADFKSQRRKSIRKERQTIADSGLEISRFSGDAIRPEHIDACWAFYQDTGQKKWGQPYLTRAFFDYLFTHLRHRLLVVLARDSDWVGGSFNLVKGNRIFGRYWGAVKPQSCLHFECCYYQLIEAAFDHHCRVVEAGAGGEHKFLRGFLPRKIYSAHRFFNPDAHLAIGQFIQQEIAFVQRQLDGLTAVTPFRNKNG